MHILIAPNAFKNSLPAPDAAKAIREGLMDSGLQCDIECFPVGDGGDGTASLIVQHLGGFFTHVRASDPLGRKINASLGFIDEGETAVLEMADVSGLKLLQSHEYNPMRATSFGCGELIRAALNREAKKIILGVGGSATVDGGCGALQAMGVRFLDASGNELKGIPGSLTELQAIDISGIDNRIFKTEFIILCDVDNFLLGPKGAASVFGPQKGASENDVIQLENALTKLRDISFIQTGSDLDKLRYGGAAGGISAGLHVYLNAKLVQGIDYFLETTGFDKALENTDILITGEGSIDLQTLEGKGPLGVARRAKKKNIMVIGLAGEVLSGDITELNEYFDVLIAVNPPTEDLKTAMIHTSANLRRSSMELGKMIAGGILKTRQ
ncbi:MAG TPA: glycerate kinase [Puia sp.]|nr:glycerate kinase [Puia sp.]